MDKGTDEKALLARANDAALLCEKQYAVKIFGFLTPAERETIRDNFKKNQFDPEIKYTFFGGYPRAERCVFAALPPYAEEADLWDFISVLEISGRDIEALNHRDFLGSLLGLGIRRDKIGDIVCLEERTLVFVLADICDYIISNLCKVGRRGVKIKQINGADLDVPKGKVEEIRTTVAAFRLDCVVAAAMKGSRARAQEVIRQKRVQLNWRECDDPSAKVSGGDVLSIRGQGRFRIGDDARETKKGRFGIVIEKAL